MELISLDFLIFYLLVIIVYFLLPGKLQWIWLLIASGFFYYKNATPLQCLSFVIILLVNYLAAFFIGRLSGKREEGSTSFPSPSFIFRIALILNILSLVVFKYAGFFLNIFSNIPGITLTGESISNILLDIEKYSPPRISYFILILIGYLTEVYWGRAKALSNPLKLMLFGSYFPLMTSGPIVEFEEAQPLLSDEKKKFSYDRFVRGFLRILWGIFKKYVISERFAIVVNTIYSDFETYPGFYVPFSAACFAIQLYTDFSGLMDIVLGISEIMGIPLPENFNTPFYSLSLAEFWRRWHITLGRWLKDYVFYAIQRTKLFTAFRKFCKKKLGRGYEKKFNLPQYLGLLISWFLIGLWHGGGFNYIFGVGLYMGIIIILSELFAPLFKKIPNLLKINTECFSYRLFERVRTFIIFIFGLSFFRAEDLTTGFLMWKNAFSRFNPWIFFDNSLYTLGLEKDEFRIALCGLFLVFLVSYFRHREEQSESGLDVRDLIFRQNLPFRLLLIVGLFAVTIIFACYGPEYNASNFIYGRF